MYKNNKTTDPLISVIIPTFNRPETLKETLKSVLAQTFQNFEVILVNDAGNPIEEIIREFLDSGKITYIRNAQNRRLPGTRNVAIRNAKGKYITYLDDDDIYYPNHLEILVDALENSDYRIAYTDSNCRLFKTEDGKQETVMLQPSYGYDFSKDLFLISNYIPVLCIMHEKSCFDEVGFFDENLSSHEDWELWIRMSRIFEFLHVKEITCEYVLSFEPEVMAKRQEEMQKTMIEIYTRTESWVNDRPDLLERRKALLIDSENRIKLHNARSMKQQNKHPKDFELLGINLFSVNIQSDDLISRINRLKGYISQERFELVRKIINSEELFTPFKVQLLSSLDQLEKK